MTKDKKEYESLEKVHRDLVSNKPSSLVKRALDDLARLKAYPPGGLEHPVDLPKRRQIRVVICSYNGDNLLDLSFPELIKEVVKDKYALTIERVDYGEELMKIAENAEADIVIVIVDSIQFDSLYPPIESIEQFVQLITQIKRAFDIPMIVLSPLELEERVKQTGADFYFQLYSEFDDDFKTALEKCISLAHRAQPINIDIKP